MSLPTFLISHTGVLNLPTIEKAAICLSKLFYRFSHFEDRLSHYSPFSNPVKPFHSAGGYANGTLISSPRPPIHETPRTPPGASPLVYAMSAWWVKTRHAPPRHCEDVRVNALKTTAVHKMITARTHTRPDATPTPPYQPSSE